MNFLLFTEIMEEFMKYFFYLLIVSFFTFLNSYNFLVGENIKDILQKRDALETTKSQQKIQMFLSPPINELATELKKIDYSLPENWYVFGDKNPINHYIPNDLKNLELVDKRVSVFYVHPSIYWGFEDWNASIESSSSLIVKDLLLVNQASVFSACCEVFAPRYRSANLYAFGDKTGKGSHAIYLAFQDVENAFMEFLRINKGKPFIIAGHSQGTNLSTLLIKKYQKKPEFDSMVAAYLIGYVVTNNQFDTIKSCTSQSQTNCYVGWNTTLENTIPMIDSVDDLLCVNPLSGSQNEEQVALSEALGSMTFEDYATADIKDEEDRQLIYLDEGKVGCSKGNLFVRETSLKQFPSRFFNMHSYDYGLFYGNIMRSTLDKVASFTQ